MRNKKLLYILPLAWMGMIFYLSSIGHYPVNLSREGYQLVSSIVHLILYIALAGLWFLAFYYNGLGKRKALIIAFLISIVYGVTDEWHQSFVVGREAHLSDWLLDFFGSIIGVLIGSLKNKLKYF